VEMIAGELCHMSNTGFLIRNIPIVM